MKILDFTNNPLTTLSFPTETLFALCYIPKVIVFETAEELHKFKAVCEIHLAEPLEAVPYLEQEFIDDMAVADICTVFVDTFEEESWLVEDPDEQRDSSIILTSDISGTTLDDSVNVYANMLRVPMSIPMTWLEVFNREIMKLLASNDLNDKLKEDTQKIFRSISKVFSEDIEAWKSGTAEYFQRDIKEER